MRVFRRVLAVAALGLAAGACSGLKNDLGLSKKAPDEFAVVRNAPLSLPPDYNLRPPKQGAVGVGQEEQRDQARGLLLRDGAGQNRGAGARTYTASQPTATPASYGFVAGRSEGAIGEISDYAFGGGQVASARAVRGRGEQALLARLDATDVDPTIRQQVDEEAKLLAADPRTFVERLMFWRTLNPPGVLVDPAQEQKRINENQALGDPVTKGDTPEIRIERVSTGFSGIKLF